MSAHDFTMPSLGADMDDGVITEWLVAPGDEVRRGQIVVVVETDKSDIEVEVFEHAVVDELLVAAGERVAVGTPIARFRPVDARGAPTAASPATDVLLVPEPEPVPEPVPARPRTTETEPNATTAPSTDVSGGPSSATGRVGVTSPLVRHLIEELHVDPDRIRGTGPGGRIHRDDVLASVSGRRMTPRARRLTNELGLDAASIPARGAVVTGGDVLAAADTAPTAEPTPTPERAAGPATRPEPTDQHADPMRRAIASLMSRSWAEIPHFHVASRVEIGAALARLGAVNAGRPIADRILPAALLLHAIAGAVRRVPAVNGWWLDGGFRAADAVDLGVVVSLRRGGIVAPTIPAVDTMTVDEVMVELAGVVSRARAGRLRSSDMREASLTVTNLGDLGADLVHGVIHPPQVALVGLGAIHDEAVAVEGLVGVRPVVYATLAGDHRALDGLVGATFLGRFATAIAASAASVPEQRPIEPERDEETT